MIRTPRMRQDAAIRALSRFIRFEGTNGNHRFLTSFGIPAQSIPPAELKPKPLIWKWRSRLRTLEQRVPRTRDPSLAK